MAICCGSATSRSVRAEVATKDKTYHKRARRPAILSAASASLAMLCRWRGHAGVLLPPVNLGPSCPRHCPSLSSNWRRLHSPGCRTVCCETVIASASESSKNDTYRMVVNAATSLTGWSRSPKSPLHHCNSERPGQILRHFFSSFADNREV
jgi:hypothetical protein